ncbi:MAG: hypothetical protein U0174_18205 [Polyangiaceae bacterium]
MMRAAVVAVLLFIAPFQCGSTRDPNLRREDTAGDALWGLAERFRAEHDEAGRRATLKYLIEKYPSNRYAQVAKEEFDADASAP